MRSSDSAWPLLAFMLVVLTAFVGEMRRYERPGGVMVNVALAIFGVAYVGLLLSFVAQLRLLGGPTDGLHRAGGAGDRGQDG